MRDPRPPDHCELPPEVLALAERCGADPTITAGTRVALRQTGLMRSDAAHRWAPFRARQTMDLDRPGFVWRAKTGPLGCIAVTDALEEAGPRLSVVALGLIPLARVAADEALTKGQLLRYLAELPLAPDAILRNRALVWQALNATTLRVAATHCGVSAQLDFTLGADGLVASIFAADRPRLEGTRTVEHPWRGHFTDYRAHCGRQLPFAAEVAWILDGRETPVWRGTMDAWTLAAGSR